MTKFALIVLALSPLLLRGQDVTTGPPPEKMVTKVIHVRYASAESVRDLIAHTNVSASANNGLKAIVVRGSESNVSAAEQAIKELDAPSPLEGARDVEVTVYVIGATSQAGTALGVVPEMEPVIRQLKAVFRYGNYEVLDSMVIRTREGRTAHTGGLLRNFPNAQVNFVNRYNIDCDLAPPEAGQNRVIPINRFSFSAGIPSSDLRVTLDTNLDLQDGQKVVVGKTNIDNGNAALFVVVTAKSVQ